MGYVRSLIAGTLLVLVLAPHGALSAEIPARVVRVDEQTVTLRSSSDWWPAVGDKLTIFVEVPEVGKASLAEATIQRLEDGQIIAVIDKSTGKVKVGQQATIQSPQPTERPAENNRALATWGVPVDPDGDCTIRAEGGRLSMTVPDGLHDLWPGRPGPGQSFNAPRVWRDVEGDFVMQVKVTADWSPYKQDTNYGAGLVVWNSDSNLLRCERHVFMKDGKPTCFAKPLYLQDGKRLDDRKFADVDFYHGRSTWLRVERTGQKIKSSISHDGKHWIDTGTLSTSFPDKVLAGVHVFKVSPGEFTAEFEDFSLRPATHVALKPPAQDDSRLPAMPEPKSDERPWLAVGMSIHGDELVVHNILPGGPGDKAGMKVGDIILTLDGKPCPDFKTFKGIVDAHQVGDTLKVTFLRDEQQHSLQVPLEAIPADEGTSLLLKAAEAGNPTAMMLIGYRYSGLDKNPNYVPAEQQHLDKLLMWFERADKQGHAPAAYQLGNVYRTGIIRNAQQKIEKDPAKAAAYYERARALSGTEKLSSPYVEASAALATMLINGQEIPGDQKRGVAIVREMADLGEANACGHLGDLYRQGRGVPKDTDLAMQWLQLGAKKGCAAAMTAIGLMSYEGDGVKKDLPNAHGWFLVAAKKGSVHGMVYLAGMYNLGEAVPRNLAEAQKLFEQACSQAHTVDEVALAEYRTGRFYEKHGGELGYDDAESRRRFLEHYRKAAPHSKDARDALERLGANINDSSKTDAPTPGHIAGWGHAVDPEGVCKVQQAGDKLTLTTPGGVYDLWYGRETYNAPRVVQDVAGDFTVQVKVTADCTGPLNDTGGMARAAGLVVYESNDHYLRQERNSFVPRKGQDRPQAYHPPVYDRNKKRLTVWKTVPSELFAGKSTWLRVQRSGQKITTGVSTDGQHWVEESTVETTFPEQVQVGVLAINNCPAEFTAEFENLSLTQP